MIKVRFCTWYWGNYCLMKSNRKLPEGFEIYDEEKHGWQNSEEYKLYKKPMYKKEDEHEYLIDSFLSSSYYTNGSWKQHNKL